MRWHRIHYTYGPAEDVIDVLSESRGRAMSDWSTWVAIRKRHPSVNVLSTCEVTYIGEGNGSLAANHDPRDEETGGSAPFQVRV